MTTDLESGLSRGTSSARRPALLRSLIGSGGQNSDPTVILTGHLGGLIGGSESLYSLLELAAEGSPIRWGLFAGFGGSFRSLRWSGLPRLAGFPGLSRSLADIDQNRPSGLAASGEGSFEYSSAAPASSSLVGLIGLLILIGIGRLWTLETLENRAEVEPGEQIVEIDAIRHGSISAQNGR